MAEERNETIALFGATGRTGKFFARFALEAGYRVKAMARSPDKMPQHLPHKERLEVIPGDFENENAIRLVLKGASYVVCMVAVTGSPYPENAMLDFVSRLYKILRQSKDRPKVVLYQAGSMSSDGEGNLHPVAWIMKQTLGRKLGILAKVEDNNAVIRFLFEHRNEIAFVVPRAGFLTEEHEQGSTEIDQRQAIASDWPPMPFQPVSFADLARFALGALQNSEQYCTSPFVRYP